MIKNEFYLPFLGQELHCVEWKPDGKPVAVLQIVHGMVEHILRYEGLAKFLAGSNIAVVGHDHPGHGKTVKSEKELGYIPKKGGSDLLVACTAEVTAKIKERIPDVPVFILGHSMGSFVLRRYLTFYGDDVSGAFIVGTGTPPTAVLLCGRMLASLISVFGKYRRSPLLKKISFAGYNSIFPREDGENAWISSDKETVCIYERDPLCGYTFTANGFYVLYDTLLYLSKKKNIERIPKKLPVFIMSGELDPVGSMGKGPRELAEQLRTAGVSNVELLLYPDSRHEIINEKDRAVVYEDIKKRLLHLAAETYQ